LKAIVFDGRNSHFATDLPKPLPEPGESLIQVELAAICNTDREILKGYRPDYRGVLGHEFVGIVRESPDPSLLNRRVVGEINLTCGLCLYCSSGRPHHCIERRALGINDKNGAFAGYLTLPTSLLHPVDEALPAEKAVFCEPLAAALRITEQVEFAPGTPVALLGDGRLALMICQSLAATQDVDLTVFGRHPEKLALFSPYAKTFGAIDTEDTFEVVVDATGNPASLSDAIALTRSEGTLVLKSTYAEKAHIDISMVVVREIRMIGSRCGPFKPALELLQTGKVDLPPLTCFAPEDFKKAMESKTFKAALDFRS